MGTGVSKFTILFEAPFWIGLYEREDNGRYEACKITFGAEPKDYDVCDFLLKNWSKFKFSPSIEAAAIAEHHMNPKRMQRMIKRQICDAGTGTKAQQALKLQHEQGQSARKSRSCERREAEKDRQFELRQERRKEKYKGH